MSDYGSHQFNAGFGRPPYLSPPPGPPPLPPARPPRPFTSLLLVISCMAVGFLLAWGIREHGKRAKLANDNRDLANAYTFVLAKRTDLVSFLTDQKTQLYRLAGHGLASGQWVTVAWQEETHRGFLIGDRMPTLADHASYTLWHVDTAKSTTPAGAFHPEPTGTLYDFHIPTPVKGTAGFKISVETTSNVTRPSQIVYETD